MHTENASFAAAPIQQRRHTHTRKRLRRYQIGRNWIEKDLDAGPQWHKSHSDVENPPMVRQSSASKMGPRCCRFSPVWTHEDFCPRTWTNIGGLKKHSAGSPTNQIRITQRFVYEFMPLTRIWSCGQVTQPDLTSSHRYPPRSPIFQHTPGHSAVKCANYSRSVEKSFLNPWQV